MEKVTIATLMEKRLKRQPITFLTGYDYPMAQMEEKAEIDIILVGDSIGMTPFIRTLREKGLEVVCMGGIIDIDR